MMTAKQNKTHHNFNTVQTIIDTFNLDLKFNGKYWQGNCPIHPISDSQSFIVYPSGKFACYSKGCHNHFYNNITGFLQGILSNIKLGWSAPGDKIYPYKDTLAIFKNLGGQKIIYTNQQRDMLDFIRKRRPKPEHKIDIISNNLLSIPSKYYLGRGFQEGTLAFFGVGDYIGGGDCRNRSVVPVHDERGTKIGWTARSHYEKCLACGLHHGITLCPSKNNKKIYAKWIHSTGLKTKQLLYNFHRAKPHAQELNSVVVVESPGNTWKLWENGIKNVVALFGANLDLRQQSLLYRLGVDNIILCLDNDGAGYSGIDLIITKLKDFFKVKYISLKHSNDLAELKPHEIQEIFV